MIEMDILRAGHANTYQQLILVLISEFLRIFLNLKLIKSSFRFISFKLNEGFIIKA